MTIFGKRKTIKTKTMLITKEQQEALVDNYMKDHNRDEVNAFIDGIGKIMETIIRLDHEDPLIKSSKLKEAYFDGFNDSKNDFDIENYK